MATTCGKRKRSAQFSPQTGATPFSPLNQHPTPAFSHDSPMTDPQFQFQASYAHLPSPSPTPHPSPDRLLHSRTRKRFRDGRPDEQSIYATTHQKLFSASALPPPPSSLPTPHPPPAPQPKSQTSLNHFWQHLPAAPSPSNNTFPATLQAMCENCGCPLGAEGEDADMSEEGGEIDCEECVSCAFGGGVGRVLAGCCDRERDGTGAMDLGRWLRRG